jgi:hypothetical protein
LLLALSTTAASEWLSVAVVPVKYSTAQLLDYYERLGGRDLPEGCVIFGIDATHNAFRLVLPRVDEDIVSYFHAQVPSEALWVEVEPRAGRAFAYGDAQDPLGT